MGDAARCRLRLSSAGPRFLPIRFLPEANNFLIFNLALCNCDFELPIEQLNCSAIS